MFAAATVSLTAGIKQDEFWMNGNRAESDGASGKKKGPAISRKPLIYMVAEDGIEPPTRGFSIVPGFQ